MADGNLISPPPLQEPPTEPPTAPTQDPPAAQDPPPAAPPPAQTPLIRSAREVDPMLSFQYSIEFSTDPLGLVPFMLPIEGYFTSISGLGVEFETIDYRTTNWLGHPFLNVVVGRPVYNPITLTRGVTSDTFLWLWQQLIYWGTKPLLKPYAMITLYDRTYKPAVRWSVENVWPTKISGIEIRAESSDVVVEEVTLVHSGIHRMYLSPELQALDLAIQMLLP
jgi:phage tail-like protein